MVFDKPKFLLNINYYSDEDILDLINIENKALNVFYTSPDPSQLNRIKNLCGEKIEIVYPKKYKGNLHKKIKFDSLNIIRNILQDDLTPLFYDRFYGKAIGSGMNNFFRYVILQVQKEIELFEKLRPDYVMFSSTPHQIESWISYQVLKQKGGEAIIPSSVTNFKNIALYVGIERNRKLIKFKRKNGLITDHDNQNFKNFINKLKASYQEAIPEYEKERLRRNNNKHFNIISELKRFWFKPHYIYHKYKCYGKYKSLSIALRDEPFIVFFMHYQPERTTLPEAFGFTQQTLAIMELRACLPDDIAIYVREHPSTFTNLCHPKHRHPSFYDDILKIHNIRLIRIEESPFEIIDKSIAVVTISGTVGIESLVRGKPTAFLGVPQISNSFGMYVYENSNGLESFFNKCLKGFDKEKVSETSVENLKMMWENSLQLCENEVTNLGLDKARRQVYLKLIKHLIKGDMEI